VLTAADTITLRAPAAPGTATVSVYTIDSSTGIATLEGTMTITFTATSGLGVSEANSTVKVGTAAGCATATAVAEADGAPVVYLCVTLKNANAAVTNGNVDVTITPVGLVSVDGTVAFAQTVNEDTVAGYAEFVIKGSGLPGVGTVGIIITQGLVSTTFAPKTISFAGALASITATSAVSAILVSGAPAAAVKFTGKDAAGIAVPVDVDNVGAVTADFANVVATGTTGVVTAMADTTADPGTITVTCGATAGVNTYAVKVGTVTSNAITVYCSKALDTYTLAFDKDTVAPGGTATATITAKDVGGQPAPDGAVVVVSTVSSGAITPWSALKDGKATATFLAPFNTGTATVLISIAAALTTASASDNISVTAPAPLPGTGTNATSLGATKTGTYTTATKIAALGKYQTWKISYGAGAAGQVVGILVATKNSAGVWSSFTRVTGRLADSAGNAYYWVYKTSAAWISVRGDLAGNLSPARQARWK
jgi:hypothetical protein